MEISENLVRWLANGDRGVSSNTIVTHMTGINCLGVLDGAPPQDPSDFIRCRKLIDSVPEIKDEFHRMSSCSPAWGRLVDQWNELCDMLDSECPNRKNGEGWSRKTYRRMQELIDSGKSY